MTGKKRTGRGIPEEGQRIATRSCRGGMRMQRDKQRFQGRTNG